MRHLLSLTQTTVFLLTCLAAPSALSALPCACSAICHPGPPHYFDCDTDCCTPEGWTSCGLYGMEGCESLKSEPTKASAPSVDALFQFQGALSPIGMTAALPSLCLR
jgi:hypothetical protein